MNTITMISVNLLEHHPQNPRLDLGDLTELTESIKKNGIMQNLTVVPDMENCKYLVVIGNRRMEAAKAAGLVEVPCVISDMDYRTQVATMLMENMQRQDLTVYEQAQGVQMMIDLGLTEGQISEMTGFSRTTVKRRAEMAKLDKETLKEKCAQLTIEDVDMLNKVKDLDKRNKLLKEAGTSSFKWAVENEIREQKRKETYQQIRDILLQAGCVEKSYREVENFWNKYEFLSYKDGIDLDKYEAGMNILPEDDRELFFYREYSSVKFWAEKRKAESADEEDDEESAEEQAKKKEVQDAWERLKEVEDHARESRGKFIETMVVKQKDNRMALNWLIIALVVNSDCLTGILPDDYDEEQIKELPKGHTETDLDLKWMLEQIDNNPHLYAEVINEMLFENENCLMNRWRTSEKPEHCRNLSMITGYKCLTEFGYQMSDEEKAYLDGTLDCFKGEEE